MVAGGGRGDKIWNGELVWGGGRQCTIVDPVEGSHRRWLWGGGGQGGRRCRQEVVGVAGGGEWCPD